MNDMISRNMALSKIDQDEYYHSNEIKELIRSVPAVGVMPMVYAGWINAKELTPNRFGWYLVCVRGWVTLAWFDSDGWSDLQTIVATPEEISHWMDLPAPPEGV